MDLLQCFALPFVQSTYLGTDSKSPNALAVIDAFIRPLPSTDLLVQVRKAKLEPLELRLCLILVAKVCDEVISVLISRFRKLAFDQSPLGNPPVEQDLRFKWVGR